MPAQTRLRQAIEAIESVWLQTRGLESMGDEGVVNSVHHGSLHVRFYKARTRDLGSPRLAHRFETKERIDW